MMYYVKMEVWKYIVKNKIILILTLLYAGLSLSFIIGNGNYSCDNGICGLHIGGWHLHDAMWHLALVKTSFSKFPFIHPEMSGAYLNGYNYLLDLVILGFTKIGLSSFFVFFKLLPILFIPIYLYLLVLFGRKYKDSSKYINWLLFFMFFGSSFTYLIPLFKDHTLYYSALKGFPVVTSIQPGLIFLNLQYAYSLLCTLGIMILLEHKRNLKINLFIGILVFLSTSLKFYGGAVAISLIGLYELFSLLQNKKIIQSIQNLIFPIIFLLLSIVLFYKSSGTSDKFPFVFIPFALTHQMIEDKLLFYNESLVNARYFLYSRGISPRLIAIEAYSIILFLLVNFGTRLVFLFSLPRKILDKKFTKLQASMLLTILVTTLMPILFIQDGGWFNSMQFLYYGVFLASFFAAETISNLTIKSKIVTTIFLILIVVLTIPNNIEQLRYIYEPQKVISQGQLVALKFLEDQPRGVVFTTYAHKETGYISALSGQQTYFVDVDQLMVTHVDYKEREYLIIKPWLVNPLKTDADYWYLVKSSEEYPLYLDKIRNSPGFKEIFNNDDVVIYLKTKLF